MERQEIHKLCSIKQHNSNVLKVRVLKCLLKRAKPKYLRKESCWVCIRPGNGCSQQQYDSQITALLIMARVWKKIWGWWVGVGKAEGRVKHQNSKEFSVLFKEHFWPLCGCTAGSVWVSLMGHVTPRAAEPCCCLEHSLYRDTSLNLFLIKLNNTSWVFLISNSDRSKARC